MLDKALTLFVTPEAKGDPAIFFYRVTLKVGNVNKNANSKRIFEYDRTIEPLVQCSASRDS